MTAEEFKRKQLEEQGMPNGAIFMELSTMGEMFLFAEAYHKHASTPTREVTEEDVRNFIDKYFESTKGSPNDIEDAIKETVKWYRDNHAPTSLPSEDQIMKELLDRWGFTEDGAVACGEQLKIFSFMKWLKSLSNTREVEGGWVKCSDRLPTEDETYTVGNPEYETGECFFEDGEWRPHNLNPYNKGNITHWQIQTLPKPPSVNSKEL